MPTYEIDKRQPASSQGMTPRRMQWTGAIGVHTCENTPDLILPDGGAEGVTNFIFTRRDAGSYHVIVDSDSVKWLFPPETWETWSVAARDEYGRRHNSYTASMSYAYRASWWGRNPDYEARMIDNGGKVCAEMLLMWSDGNVDQALKACVWRTPREIADGRPGFFEHGSVQADRNDAWSEHPQRDDLRRRHIEATRLHLGTSQEEEEEEMKAIMLRDRFGAIWLVWGNSKVHVPGMDQFNLYRFLGVQFIDGDNTTWLQGLGTLENGIPGHIDPTMRVY